MAILEVKKDIFILTLQSNRFKKESRKIRVAITSKNLSYHRQKTCKIILEKNKKILDLEL